MSFAAYCTTVARNFEALQSLEAELEAAAKVWHETLDQGGKILFCGNGGSAADAQHLAAELVGRYKKDRPSLPSIALTVDSSALTAIGNDYGYEEVFARQVAGLACEGDLLVGISTSGNSANVIRAIERARDLGVRTMTFTGQSGGTLRGLCDLCLAVPSDQTNHIQEMHIAVGHYLCGEAERRLGLVD
ncbi:D-sedoheptulose 7-phosphate isomerase [Kiloniella sp. b19]|uniref:D-sedoheptulose 7-phosphate isomerase n=1 Tax=Kiloniella sp. GXU_MW_B19 TaxID=3141326 RepID=UPI0031D4C299